MISFEHVTKQYPEHLALDDLNLTIHTGELFVLVGPSGSGKTTTLKMINRLIDPTSGTVKIGDQNVTDYNIQALRLTMGYVLQNIALFPNMTIQDNIAIQPEALRWPRAKRIERSRQLLTQVHLSPDDYANRYPRELSGGEQQRVGIVRALATEPKIILMDEPFSALDPISRKQLQDLVLQLHQSLNLTIVFVTHDMREALRLGTRVAVMRNGHIQQVGTPNDIRQHPANDFIKEFFISAEDQQQTLTVDELLLSGYDRPVEPDKHYMRIPKSASLNNLAQTLKSQPNGVIVTRSDGQDMVITTQDLLSYISERGV
ncbi:ABC transporter ATP-binding protein [Levilactobacillus bambusae]|uniref:ABC-type quaternary amine transporter n=1 Tax=Levilactobacillus bambusae TaxID=2024736 RepID=A0A2V1MZ93_9LACO|nr:ABC transporter ATP-binding protein [Levilactobacillus bambusae]PWG00287.1 proline/glycine betaine ABC transporter ATP-binding protein [Levilactobacillus bambusae]